MPLPEIWEIFLEHLHQNNVTGVMSILSQSTAGECDRLINENYGINNGIREEEVDGIPLHIAAYYHNPAMIETLIQYGADINIENSDAENALEILCKNHQDYCSTEQKSEIIRIFLRNGAQYTTAFEALLHTAFHHKNNQQWDLYGAHKYFLHVLHTHEVYTKFLGLVKENNENSVKEYLNADFKLTLLLPSSQAELSSVKIDRALILKHPESFETLRKAALINSGIAEFFREIALDLETAIQTKNQTEQEPILWWWKEEPCRYPVVSVPEIEMFILQTPTPFP